MFPKQEYEAEAAMHERKRRRAGTLTADTLQENELLRGLSPVDLSFLDMVDVSCDAVNADEAEDGLHWNEDMHALSEYLLKEEPADRAPSLAQLEPQPEPVAVPESDAVKPPKGYVSAFNFYFKARRKELLKARADEKMSANALNKYIGVLWKQLAPHEREEFDDMARKDKERYLLELMAYNEKATDRIAPRINAPPGFTFPSTVASIVPTRALTAYSIFAQHERLFITKNRDAVPPHVHAQMGQYFGMRWKSMCHEEKHLYLQLEKAYKQASVVSAH